MIPSRSTRLLPILLLLAAAVLPVPATVKLVSVKWPLPPIPPGALVYPDLSYVSGGVPNQRLDLYEPRAGRHLPLIIFIHGGAFLMGDKRKWVRFELNYLEQGYAMASINYRLSSQAVFPAQIDDCKAAVRWLRAHAARYRLDPDHFAAWGASAGGMLAALLGTTGNIRDFDVGDRSKGK